MKPSDLTLFAYIFFLVPAMLVGFGFARRKLFVPHHKLTMTTITIINWILIIFLMLVTYKRDVAPQVPQNLKLSAVFIPTMHLVFGLTAQLIASYLVIRMWFEKRLPTWFKVKNIKLYMRTTLVLWLLTALFGLTTWAVFYHDFLSSPAAVSVNTDTNAKTPVIQMVSGNAFSPAELSIAAGTTIHFVNADSKKHTVTADDGSFDSGELKTGDTFDFTFNAPGDIKYYCSFHGDKDGVGMSGVIHVAGKAIAGTASATSPATLVPAVTQETTNPGPQQTEQVTKAAPATQSANAANNVTMSLTDDQFNPTSITVAPGTTIHFVNNGKHKHTVTADDGSFDSGQLKAGDHFDQLFNKVGDVPLYCSNHGDKGGQGMSMVVHVVAAAGSNQANRLPAGTAQATLAPLVTPGVTIVAPFQTEQPTRAPIATTQAPSVPVQTGPATSAVTAAQIATVVLLPTFTGTLDAASILALKPLIVSADETPGKVSYVAGIKAQEAIVVKQAAAVNDAIKQGHLEGALAAAEAILNIIVGGVGTDFDGNGTANQPGDGFGLKFYVFSMNEAAAAAHDIDALPVSVHRILIYMQTDGQNSLKDMQDLSNQATALLAVKSLLAAQQIAPSLSTAATNLDDHISALLQVAANLPPIQ